ncbi:unnamed protein product [Caenorhabditis angaria]|uniref:Uncharacterized protein n=1 Tax=Caenorhabditis angaria TaxID=860376 RepID=A0A9P1I621_9PELO|nr:unnamed protein product [Caenorhabditis angaria]
MFNLLIKYLSLLLKLTVILTIFIQCQSKKKKSGSTTKSNESVTNPICYDNRETASTPVLLRKSRSRKKRITREEHLKQLAEISKMISKRDMEKKKLPELELQETQQETEKEEVESSEIAKSEKKEKEKITSEGNGSIVEDVGEVELIARRRMSSQTRKEIRKKAEEMARRRQQNDRKRLQISDLQSPDDTMKDVSSIKEEDRAGSGEKATN